MPERARAARIGAAVVAAGLTLVGCSGGGPSDSARSAADTFMSAAGTLDYAKAATVISNDNDSIKLNMNTSGLFELPSNGVTNFQYTFVSDTADTDVSHTVVYAVKDRSVQTPNILDNGVDSLTVNKENGSWKVHDLHSQGH